MVEGSDIMKAKHPEFPALFVSGDEARSRGQKVAIFYIDGDCIHLWEGVLIVPVREAPQWHFPGDPYETDFPIRYDTGKDGFTFHEEVESSFEKAIKGLRDNVVPVILVNDAITGHDAKKLVGLLDKRHNPEARPQRGRSLFFLRLLCKVYRSVSEGNPEVKRRVLPNKDKWRKRKHWSRVFRDFDNPTEWALVAECNHAVYDVYWLLNSRDPRISFRKFRADLGKAKYLAKEGKLSLFP